MIRQAFWAATVLIATLATSAALSAAPAAADTAVGNHLCEAYGNQYCVGADNLDLYTHLVEQKPGRDITATRITPGSFEGLPIFFLEFNLDRNKCVASTNGTLFVDIRPCGNTGTVWALAPGSSGNDLWINRYATEQDGADQYLTGLNDGTEYELLSRPGPTGSNQQFHWK
jgi:hypothetical protein